MWICGGAHNCAPNCDEVWDAVLTRFRDLAHEDSRLHVCTSMRAGYYFCISHKRGHYKILMPVADESRGCHLNVFFDFTRYCDREWDIGDDILQIMAACRHGCHHCETCAGVDVLECDECVPCEVVQRNGQTHRGRIERLVEFHRHIPTRCDRLEELGYNVTGEPHRGLCHGINHHRSGGHNRCLRLPPEIQSRVDDELARAVSTRFDWCPAPGDGCTFQWANNSIDVLLEIITFSYELTVAALDDL